MKFFQKSLWILCPKSVGSSFNRRLHCELLEGRNLLSVTAIFTSPLTGSSAPVDGNIEVTFDATISASSVTDQSFVVHRKQSGRLLSSLGDLTSLGSLGALVTLDPTNNFYPGEHVQVTATNSLQADSFITVSPLVWSFQAATAGGSGVFEENGQTLGSATTWHVALGDLDSDGDLDAFVTNLQDAGLPLPNSRVWINQGGQQGGVVGQFVDSGQLLENNRPHDLALGDLDGDGDLDVFIGNSSNRPNTVWFNQGGLQNGTEGLFSDSGQRLGNSPTRGVALGDLDGDGDLDVFASNRNNQANRIWINQGGLQGGTAGQFQDSGQRLGSSGSFGVALGDLDLDGDLDAFVANHSPLGSSVLIGRPNLVWINDGSGTFIDTGQRLGDFPSRAVSLGDLDLDGDLDAFIANGRANRVWLNQGGVQGGNAGQFVDSGQTLGLNSSHDVSLGDLDADGDLDAFVANTSLQPSIVWINQGGTQGGTTGAFSNNGQSLGNADSRGVALGDLDNDGDLDAYVANFGVTNGGTGVANRVWLNQNVSADFDLDNDVDGTDFLTWQRGYGMANDAEILDGDADRNGAVDGADLAVWETQMGTSSPPIAASFASSSNSSPSLVLLSDIQSTDFAPLQGVFNPVIWRNVQVKDVQINELKSHVPFLFARARESKSIRHQDPAVQCNSHGIAVLCLRQSSSDLSDEDIHSLALDRKHHDLKEERVDTVFTEWRESQDSIGLLLF